MFARKLGRLLGATLALVALAALAGGIFSSHLAAGSGRPFHTDDYVWSASTGDYVWSAVDYVWSATPDAVAAV
jgi:hypothetical protein